MRPPESLPPEARVPGASARLGDVFRPAPPQRGAPVSSRILGPTAMQRSPGYATITPKVVEEPVDVGRFRRIVSLTHTFVLFTIMVPPFIMCQRLAADEDVRYFVGTGPAYVAYFMVPLGLIVPILHGCMRRVPEGLFIVSVLVPSLVFALIGYHYRDYLHSTLGALNSDDCNGFAEKRALQRTYREATELYDQCILDVGSCYSIKECPSYFEFAHENPREVLYLQALERRFPCAGMCESGRRLWENAGRAAPGCTTFVAQWVRMANTQATIIFVYSCIVSLGLVPVYVLTLERFFKDHYRALLGA